MIVGLLVLALLLAVVTVVAALAVGGRSLDPNLAAGVFPPWWSRAAVQSAAAAAGHIMGTGPLPFVVVVRNHRTNVVDRLRLSGALFSLDARLVRVPKGSWG